MCVYIFTRLSSRRSNSGDSLETAETLWKPGVDLQHGYGYTKLNNEYINLKHNTEL